jgi:hypothetical protein
MFDFFKPQKKEDQPIDVKTIRDSLLRFMKEQLQKLEGGEGANIKGLHLFIACSEAEKHLYEASVYAGEEDRFKNEEVQKIADDYALTLPENWTLDVTFTDTLPAEAIKAADLNAALLIVTRKQPSPLHKTATAYIKVINGESEQAVYTITSSSGKVNIGREQKVQTRDGFFRINHIAFPANSSHESNKFVSRQHAHIEYDAETGVFLLFADEGGVPPRNKIKVRSTQDSNAVKLHTTQIGHPLQEGDQIILGDSALLEFSYSAYH